jgi:hypothetical protein
MYHLQCGDDDWNPSDEDLAKIVKGFQEADVDSLGRMFVPTRHSVNVTTYPLNDGPVMSATDLVRAVAEVVPSSLWKHKKSGDFYRVSLVTNLDSTDGRYAPTVVYRNVVTGSWWSRPLHDWYRSMVLRDLNETVVIHYQD